MSDDVRFQRKCFYSSPEHSGSFWGKFLWLYQGRGSLRLTPDALCLKDGARDLVIPLHAIKSIGLGQASVWAKPFGLSHLIVRYAQDGEPGMIQLTPYESALDPSWETSKLVASWYETLGRVEVLANRIEPPQFDPAATSSFGKGVVLTACLVLIPLTLMLLSLLLMHS